MFGGQRTGINQLFAGRQQQWDTMTGGVPPPSPFYLPPGGLGAHNMRPTGMYAVPTLMNTSNMSKSLSSGGGGEDMSSNSGYSSSCMPVL
jgi:hypothetical protein